jgi:hypothetical protein
MLFVRDCFAQFQMFGGAAVGGCLSHPASSAWPGYGLQEDSSPQDASGRCADRRDAGRFVDVSPP